MVKYGFHVGKYTSPMDGMGKGCHLQMFRFHCHVRFPGWNCWIRKLISGKIPPKTSAVIFGKGVTGVIGISFRTEQ